MELHESLYLIIMFSVPAAMHIIYNAFIRIVPRNQPDKSIELAENIIFCSVVFILNLIILNEKVMQFTKYIFLNENERELSTFAYIDFAILYTIVNLITSLFVIIFWYKFGKSILLWVVNKINKKSRKVEELEFPDVWRNIFENNKIIENIFDVCIVIEQGGVMMTAGLLQTYQSPNCEDRELLLYNTEQIKEIFREDEKKSPCDKVFYPALYEFYDGKSSLLFKFYALDKYKEIFESK
nr:MAG TPA: hypothetical protein [Bacteriophage sp.]